MNKLLMSITFAIVLMLAVAPANAKKEKDEDVWAACILAKLPTSARNWIDLPYGGNYGYGELPLFDRNFAKKMDQDLTLNDQLKSSFLELRVEAACKDDVLRVNAAKTPKFNAKNIRKALSKLGVSGPSADTLDPKAYVCIAHDGQVIKAMSSGAGDGSSVKTSNPDITLICFNVSNEGKLVDRSIKHGSDEN